MIENFNRLIAELAKALWPTIGLYFVLFLIGITITAKLCRFAVYLFEEYSCPKS